jgi:hypothetical protein
MYDPAALYTEIEDIFRHRIDAGEIVRAEWITHEILSRHPLPDFPDSDFTECCRRLALSEAVRKVNRRFKEEPGTVAQGELPLPGYTYLQRAYSVERDAEIVWVPLARLTSAERRAKVALYRQMAAGCQGHADELERYDGQAEAAD